MVAAGGSDRGRGDAWDSWAVSGNGAQADHELYPTGRGPPSLISPRVANAIWMCSADQTAALVCSRHRGKLDNRAGSLALWEMLRRFCFRC